MEGGKNIAPASSPLYSLSTAQQDGLVTPINDQCMRTRLAQLDSVFPVPLCAIRPVSTPQQDYGFTRVPGFGMTPFSQPDVTFPPHSISTPQQDYGLTRIPGMSSCHKVEEIPHGRQIQVALSFNYRNDNYLPVGVSRKRSRPTSLLGLSRPTLPSELYKRRHQVVEKSDNEDALLLKLIDREESAKFSSFLKQPPSESINHEDEVPSLSLSKSNVVSPANAQTCAKLEDMRTQVSSLDSLHKTTLSLSSSQENECDSHTKSQTIVQSAARARRPALLFHQAIREMSSSEERHPAKLFGHDYKSTTHVDGDLQRFQPTSLDVINTSGNAPIELASKSFDPIRVELNQMIKSASNSSSHDDHLNHMQTVVSTHNLLESNFVNQPERKIESICTSSDVGNQLHSRIVSTSIANQPERKIESICTSSDVGNQLHLPIVSTSIANQPERNIESICTSSDVGNQLHSPIVSTSIANESERKIESICTSSDVGNQLHVPNASGKSNVIDRSEQVIVSTYILTLTNLDRDHQSKVTDDSTKNCDLGADADEASSLCFACSSRDATLKCCNCVHMFCGSCCSNSTSVACHTCAEFKRLHRDTDAGACRMFEAAEKFCFDLEDCNLPLVVVADGRVQKADESLLIKQFKLAQSEAVRFVLGPRLMVEVSRRDLDCCGGGIVWHMLTRGFCHMGQEELLFLLQCEESEEIPPWDLFSHICSIAEGVAGGRWICESSVSLATKGRRFLDSDEQVGFIFQRATFQCVKELSLRKPSCLIALLIQRDEATWAKLFPLRLTLGLGAQHRLYPSPLVSVRCRPSVYGHDTSQTILNLFADFKNHSFTMTQVAGLSLLLSPGRTEVRFVRQRSRRGVQQALSSMTPDCQLLSMRADFCSLADSHLIAVQDENGRFKTQAISLAEKAHHLTGASFLVLNGGQRHNGVALVEDGLVVQLTMKDMDRVSASLKEMQPLTLHYSSNDMDAPSDDMVLEFVWIDDAPTKCWTSIESVYFQAERECTNDEFDIINVRFPFIHDYNHSSKALTRLRACSVRYLRQRFVEKVASSKVDVVVKFARELSIAVLSVLEPIAPSLLDRGHGQVALLVTFDSPKIDYEVSAAAFDHSAEEVPLGVHHCLPADSLTRLEEVVFPFLNKTLDLFGKEGPVAFNMNFSIMDFIV